MASIKAESTAGLVKVQSKIQLKIYSETGKVMFTDAHHPFGQSLSCLVKNNLENNPVSKPVKLSRDMWFSKVLALGGPTEMHTTPFRFSLVHKYRSFIIFAGMGWRSVQGSGPRVKNHFIFHSSALITLNPTKVHQSLSSSCDKKKNNSTC